MTKALQACAYEIFQIEKNGKIVDITGQFIEGAKTAGFNYYESLFSPNITAILSLMDIGGSYKMDEKYDPQGRFSTLSSALPLTGDAFVRFKIAHKYGNLDFSNNPLFYDVKLSPDQSTTKQALMIGLVSKAAKDNQSNTVKEKYSGNMADTVRKLVKKYLKTDKLSISPTKEPYQFAGENRSVFEVIVGELAPQASPVDGNPGYFFYETRDGFNFRSIDDLITQKPKAEYFLRSKLKANLDNDDNDFKIILKSDIKSDDNITLLKSGVTQRKITTLNLKDRKCESFVYKFDQLKTSLGKDVDVPTTESFVKTSFYVKSVGTYESTPKGKIINDPAKWRALSTMRYNLLFSQIIHVQVPCNPQLMAGDTIICDFEPITQDSKVQGSDPVQSGKYLICNLCHSFSPTKSITSMTLVRDSYGLYTNKNKK